MNNILTNKKINIVAFILLIIVILFLYIGGHTFGALGDDSPGYIFMASKYFNGSSPIFVDQTVSDIIDILGRDRIDQLIADQEMDFLLPHFNYKLLSYSGKIAPEVALGFPFAMNLMGKIFSSDVYFYLLNPLVAVGSLIILYFIVLEILFRYKYMYLIALTSVFLLAFFNYFWSLSLGEPITEIITLFFLLTSLLIFIKWINKDKYYYLALFALFFGVAMNFRITSVIFIPAYIGAYFLVKKKIKTKFKFIVIYALIFILIVSSVYLFTIDNNFNSKNEISSTFGQSITANADHTQGLSLVNLYNNQGKYRAGEGGIMVYYDFIKSISPLGISFILILTSLIYFSIKDRKLLYFSILWILPTYLFFSMWVNPYGRYIFNLVPALAILLAFALVLYFRFINSLEFNKYIKTLIVFLTIILIIISFYPNINNSILSATSKAVPTDRSVTKNDLMQIKDIHLDGTKPVIVFLDNTIQYAAFIEAHTKIRSLKQFPDDLFDELINGMKDKGYEIYFWYDKTSDYDLYQITSTYHIEEVNDFQFEFGDIILYKINEED